MRAAAIRTDTRPTFDGSLERILCVLVVASAIKTPLGIPLYLNSGLLVVGVFWLVVRPSMPSVLLWMVGLTGLGCLAALQLHVISDSGPRLLQLLLILLPRRSSAASTPICSAAISPCSCLWPS